jgi:hypothetical protein
LVSQTQFDGDTLSSSLKAELVLELMWVLREQVHQETLHLLDQPRFWDPERREPQQLEPWNQSRFHPAS